jgi:hypothetical protein
MKKVHWLLLSTLLLGCARKTVDTKLPHNDKDLVAYYPFEGNAHDESNNQNHGIVYQARPSSDISGRDGSAYAFNGTGGHILAPAHPSLNVEQEITITAWIKPISTRGQYIVHKAATAGGGGPYSLDIYPGTIRVLLYGVNGGYLELSGMRPIQKDLWQHIAMTYDGKITRLYYNGQPDGSAATTGRIATSNKGLEIGTYLWGQPTPYYEGTIDNVRIYKRALDASEIVSLFEEYR